jgi:hypothetical protein
MVENGEIIECGFLIGGKCRANPNKPFHVSGFFLENIKIVGCQSYQRYLDYATRREKHGDEAVDGKEGTDSRTERPVQELSEPEMGRNRDIERGHERGQVSLPVSVLQESNHSKGNPADNRPTGSYLKCGFCDGEAVVTDCGIHYCKKCAEKMGLK